MTSIVIPADYCVALIDAGAYPSFLDLNWTLEQIKQHFVSQMNQGTMLAWGTGASANWHIETVAASEVSRGFREFTGRITATSDRLYLVSYEDLTAVAQYEDDLLPQPGCEADVIPVTPGVYDCRIVQLYATEEADSDDVFDREEPHFHLVITAAVNQSPVKFEEVPWFPEGDD